MPAQSSRSLIPNGTPASVPTGSPRLILSSILRASRSANSQSRWTNATNRAFVRSTKGRTSSNTSIARISRWRIASTISRAFFMAVLCYNRVVRLTIAMLSAILALAGSSVAASAAVVAAGFVAVTNGSGSLQISAFRLDGSLERRLTTGPANHHYPSLSPDGTELLYTGDEGGYDEIYRIHVAEPTAAVRITAAPLMANSASWSPD